MNREKLATAIALFTMTFSAQVAHSQRAIAFDSIVLVRGTGTWGMRDKFKFTRKIWKYE